MKVFRIIFIAVLTTTSLWTLGQPVAKPEIGKPMREFVFKNVWNYPKSAASLADFKGKWLFLDMWAASCKACIVSFPKLQKLQDEFPKETRFLLVGSNETRYNKGVEKVYENAVKKIDLKIPSAFDSTVFTAWDVGSLPQIFIVDPQGILRFVTPGVDLTAKKIQDLIEGKKVSFVPSYDDLDHPSFDVVNTFGGDRVISCSVLTRWNNEARSGDYSIDEFAKLPEAWPSGWKVSGFGLTDLYNYAYFGIADWMWYDSAYYGKICPKPVLQLHDTSAFSIVLKSEMTTGLYNYCLKLPNSNINAKRMMSELQRTLDLAFGYRAAIETRLIPVGKLIALPGSGTKLKTQGGKRFLSKANTRIGFSVRNNDMRTVLFLATEYLGNLERMVFIDETGIKEPVDITLEGDMSDWEGVRKALQPHGLDLLKSRKEMKVLVIRDPK